MFLFGKLPVDIQNDLSLAVKRDATVNAIRDFSKDVTNTNSSWKQNSHSPSMNSSQARTNTKLTAHRRQPRPTAELQCYMLRVQDERPQGFWLRHKKKRTCSEGPTSYGGYGRATTMHTDQTRARENESKPYLICQICEISGYPALTYRQRNTNTFPTEVSRTNAGIQMKTEAV